MGPGGSLGGWGALHLDFTSLVGVERIARDRPTYAAARLTYAAAARRSRLHVQTAAAAQLAAAGY